MMPPTSQHTPGWTPAYARWDHGGWYVVNVQYPSGAVGCVSCNYPDKKWRIVCDSRIPKPTFRTRDDAATAEAILADRQMIASAPRLLKERDALYAALQNTTDMLAELARYVSDDQQEAANEAIAIANAALALVEERTP